MSGAISGLTDLQTSTISSKSLSIHLKTKLSSIVLKRSNLRARNGPKTMYTQWSMNSSQQSPITDQNISLKKV